MKRFLNIVAFALGVLLTLGITVYAFANASSADEMVGVVVDKKAASFEAMDQPGAKGSIMVQSIDVPGASWIAVHLDDDGMPGKRIGLKSVPAGESSDVEVEIDDVKLTDKLLVAVHADRGVTGTFEFNPEVFDSSPDKPYFVDGMELAMPVSVAIPPFGVKAGEGEASVMVAAQPGAKDTLMVEEAVAPTGAWIVVHLNEGGMPGKRVGVQQVPAGKSEGVAVKLDSGVALTDSVFVVVHADRGKTGEFEFDMMDKYSSPDQPFFVNGEEVATAVTVTDKPFGVRAAKGTASIVVSGQEIVRDSLVVDRAVAPIGAWVVVHLDEGGMPGKRVGYAQIIAGVSTNVIVKLDPKVQRTETLFVAVHADRGQAGRLEFDMMDKFDSPDQPFFVDGGEVATAVVVR